jgi:hypothetical protein
VESRHAGSSKSLQEQHQAAQHAMQAQLSNQALQLQAAGVKAEEDKAAMAAADQRAQQQDAQVENLKQQMAGENLGLNLETCPAPAVYDQEAPHVPHRAKPLHQGPA